MIREAEPQDRARIEQLYKILIPDDHEITVLDERIAYIKNDPHNFLLVYEIEGKVEGTILLTICPDPMYGNRPYAMLENLIIDPACQGKGVGKQLFEYIDIFCKERGCREILLLSHASRTRAHQFFEQCGYAHVAKGFKKYI